jgi:hypothetical protein
LFLIYLIKKKESGFVTTRSPQLAVIIGRIVYSKDNDRVIAYLFTGSWDFFSQWPIFNHITAQFPNLNFFFDITTTHTFQYGPICIAKEYQQRAN